MCLKKAIFSVSLLFLSSFVFPLSSEIDKNFVKGNLSDKIKILNSLSGKDAVSVAKKGLDFTIENSEFISSDSEFVQLALASVNALPLAGENFDSIKQEERTKISEKLMLIFKVSADKNLRASIMGKLTAYSRADQNLLIDFLNDYLAESYKRNEKTENVLEEAIKLLGSSGNNNSLSIIYNIWASKIWPEYKDATDEALVSLTQDSFSDAIKIFSISNIEGFANYFAILKKSSKISKNSLCNIAENALLIAINNAEKLKAPNSESAIAFVGFQKEVHELLCENKWSHAANAICTNVELAKKAYDDGIMAEEDFIKIIRSSSNIPSQKLAQILTQMLSECNGKVEKSKDESEMPAKGVVLALITTLGELGDKTAFDTLLFVTYLSYPIEIVDEAKKSLAILNW